MPMTPRLRKLVLTAHITISVGWLGAVAGFLALNIAGLTSRDVGVVHSAYFAMNLIGRYVVVPLSLSALATGLIESLNTEWGLVRHYWVLVKFGLTLFATIVLLVKIPLMGYAARRAAEMTLPDAELQNAGTQLLFHSTGGILVLLVITTLSVFKPWGRTPYGRSKGHQGRPEIPSDTPLSTPSAPPDLENEKEAHGVRFIHDPFKPKKICYSIVAAFLLLAASTATAAEDGNTAPRYSAMAPIGEYLLAVQDEIKLARSAAPPSISDDAEVLVLGTHGFEIVVKGKNGFACFVERSWCAGFDEPEFWNPKIRSPNCFNSSAVRSVLPHYIKRAEWVLAGLTREQMKERAQAEFSSGRLSMPEPAAFSFMLSKQGYLGDAVNGPWLPHVMLFVPRGQASVWGASKEGSPILGEDGSAIEPTILFIPVRHWSDGSAAYPDGVTTHKH